MQSRRPDHSVGRLSFAARNMVVSSNMYLRFVIALVFDQTAHTSRLSHSRRESPCVRAQISPSFWWTDVEPVAIKKSLSKCCLRTALKRHWWRPQG
jgi:hypothetical protein